MVRDVRMVKRVRMVYSASVLNCQVSNVCTLNEKLYMKCKKNSVTCIMLTCRNVNRLNIILSLYY